MLNEEEFDEDGKVRGGDGVVYNWKTLAKGGGLTIIGNGFSINGLHYSGETYGNVALFTNVVLNEIIDLVFENIYINASGYATLFWYCKTIVGLTVRSGFLSAKKAGITTFCWNADRVINYAQIKAVTNLFGLCGGVVENGVVKNCINYANLMTGTSGAVFVYEAKKGCKIENCINYGNLSGSANVGGIVYVGDSIVIDCCKNYGDIVAETYQSAGVVVLPRGNIIIKNCESYGVVESNSDDNCGMILGALATSSYLVDKTILLQNIKVVKTAKERNRFNGLMGSQYAACKVIAENIEIVFEGNCALRTNTEGIICYSCLDLEIRNVYIRANISQTDKQINLIYYNRGNFVIKNVLIEGYFPTVNICKVKLEEATKTIDSIILNHKNQSGTRFYYGKNFDSFFSNWKTGEIKLKKFSVKSFYQGEVTEEFLLGKGFVKKDI